MTTFANASVSKSNTRKSEPPKVLLLDVMGTLVHDPSYYEVLNFLGVSFEEFRVFADRDAWGAFERNEIDDTAYAQKMFMDRRKVDIEGLREVLVASYRWLPGIEDLLQELVQQRVNMHALSNYPHWYHMIEEKLKLSQYLRWTFVSCDTALRKPLPEVYQHAAATLQLNTDACLFVDDREKNCEGARSTGMHTWLFNGAEGLRSELVGLGIL